MNTFLGAAQNLSAEVIDLRTIARGSPGFSGADLANLVNEAALLAARDLFGDAFVEHYAATRDWEEREFRKAVTDWELARYFEII